MTRWIYEWGPFVAVCSAGGYLAYHVGLKGILL